MKFHSHLSILAMGLSLGSCGSEGNSGIASTPAPLPSPAATPSPTPAPAPTTNRAPVSSPVVATERFAAVSVIATSVGELAGPPSVSVGRDASGGYTITLPVVTALPGSSSIGPRTLEFSASTRTDSSAGTLNFRALQSADSATEAYDNAFFIDLPQSGGNHFRYLHFAQLALCNSVSGGSCPAAASGLVDNLVVFGPATPASEIPAGGSASYAGDFRITRFYTSLPPEISGQIGMTLDFASGNVSGKLSNVRLVDGGSSDGIPANRQFDDFAITGKLGAQGTLAGALKPPAGTVFSGGNWSAALFGPGAAEIGGTLLLDQPGIKDGPYVGTFGAAKQ